MPDPGAARSFWLDEALREEPGEPCPPLDANVAADVCIVGGGFPLDGGMGVRAGAWQEGISRRSAIDLCARLGYGDRMVALTASETRARADSPMFEGGAFIRDAAVVQPARLARGLRRLVL